MQVTFFSVIMAVIWSSVLIVLLYLLRSRLLIVDSGMIHGIVALYVFCIFRMLIPIEFSWTRVVDGGRIWDTLCLVNTRPIFNNERISINFRDITLIVWTIGAMAGVLKICAKYTKTIKFVKKIIKDSELYEHTENKIDIVKTHQVSSPCSVGIIHKKILIPDCYYSIDEYKHIIAHECAHHRNKDLLIKLLTNLFCALFWWNPITFFLKKDLYQSMEIRCDLFAVKKMDDNEKADYLSTILKEYKRATAIENVPEYIVSIEGVRDGNSLVERFEIVSKCSKKSALWRKMITVTSLIVIFVLSYSFVIQSAFDPEEIDNSYEGKYYDGDNSYILKKTDGTYILVNDDFEAIIDSEIAAIFEEGGIYIREE